MSAYETNLVTKPYVFVPILKAERKTAPGKRKILTQGETGSLCIQMEVLTPLHIHGGGVQLWSEEFVATFYRMNGQCCVPGSSVRGLLRSIYESITKSCVTAYPMVAGRPHPAMPYSNSSCRKEQLCPACTLFGAPLRQGKLQCGYFTIKNNMQTTVENRPSLHAPFQTYRQKPGMGNERLYYGALPGLSGVEVARLGKEEFWKRKNQDQICENQEDGKPVNANKLSRNGMFNGRKIYKHSDKKWQDISAFYEGADLKMECLAVGTILEGYLRYQGLSKQELGALLFALGMDTRKNFYHSLGYAKPAYFGLVKLTASQETGNERYEQPGRSEEELHRMAIEYYEENKEELRPIVRVLTRAWGVYAAGGIVQSEGQQYHY
ncbi:MAG: RAMP superfamily CRISPR-associated protein [Clostridium sp.]|jgi:hypothetical protein|nr:RAMP superfamily CRISPR-associated protein [Clostridium sp.]